MNSEIKVMMENKEGVLEECNFNFMLSEDDDANTYEEFIGDMKQGFINIYFKSKVPVFGIILWNVYTSPSKGVKKISLSVDWERKVFLANKGIKNDPFGSHTFCELFYSGSQKLVKYKS